MIYGIGNGNTMHVITKIDNIELVLSSINAKQVPKANKIFPCILVSADI